MSGAIGIQRICHRKAQVSDLLLGESHYLLVF